MNSILLCGEGDHDIGCREWDPRKGDWDYKEGWLQPLLRNLLGDQVTLVPARRNLLTLLPRDSNKHKPLPKGHGAKALFSAYLAKQRGCDAVVFMADNDSNCSKIWREKCQQIADGFAEFPESVSGVACVPKSTSECWLLADKDAWPEENDKLEDVGAPESLWGDRNDPNANHPKHVFKRQCDAAGIPDNRASREMLANDSNVEKIEAKCPESFATFKELVEGLARAAG